MSHHFQDPSTWTMQPRAHQQEALAANLAAIRAGKLAIVDSMATGTGKTMLAAMMHARLLRPQDSLSWGLTIVPWIDLVGQTVQGYEAIFSRNEIGLVHERVMPQPGSRVVVASLSTLLRPGRIQALLDHFGGVPPDLLHDDECHHGRLTEKFLQVGRYLTGVDTVRLGTSATTFRRDNRSLARVWPDGQVYTLDLMEAIMRDILCDVEAQAIETDLALPPSFDAEEREDDEELPEDVQAALARSNRYAEGFLGWKKHTEGRLRTVLFASSRQDCFGWRDHFASQGVEAAVILDNTAPTTRRKVYQRIASGDLLVVINYAVIATGVDIPAIECIMLTRPMSKGLMIQAIGRGTRKAAGKKKCLVLYQTDRRHTLSVPRVLIGSSEDALPSLRERARQRLEEQEQTSPRRESYTVLPDLTSRIHEVRSVALDLFTGGGWIEDPVSHDYMKHHRRTTVVCEYHLIGWRPYVLEGSRKRYLSEEPLPARAAMSRGQSHLEYAQEQQSRWDGTSAHLAKPLTQEHWEKLAKRRVWELGTYQQALAAGTTEGDFYRLYGLLNQYGNCYAANQATGRQCVGRVPKPKPAREEEKAKSRPTSPIAV